MIQTKKNLSITLFVLACTLFNLTAFAQANMPSAPMLAEQDGALGLYEFNQFNIVQGHCADCKTSPQALWYFKSQHIAVPKIAASKPPLVWLGSTQVINNTHIPQGANSAHALGNLTEGRALYLTNKIPTNLSYWDDATLAFFKQRPIRLRGEMTDKGFEVRTVWPLDFKLPQTAKVKPLQANERLKSLVQFEHGGAKSAYETRLLWAKNEEAQKIVAGKAIIGFMLNGAQGDDDEAHGGHFSVVTGRMEADGNYARWLVNNDYNLASNSEKGIIAGVTPMDNYLADLNSGQSYYRPSYMLVAVLKSDAVASQFQTATNQVFEHFYKNDFLYDHSRENCAGISLDTLSALGWKIPARGVESQLKATAAYFYVAATEMSLTKGRAIYDYLNTETTRLFPAVTFDAIGEDLLNGANQWSRQLYLDHNPTTPYMRQIGKDIEAIYFVRIPQIPSSRAFGQAPVYSFNQYMKQAPADRSKWKVVPTTPNLLPENLKANLALKSTVSLIPVPVLLVMLIILMLMGWLASMWLTYFKTLKK